MDIYTYNSGGGGAINVPVGPSMDLPGASFTLPFTDPNLDSVGEFQNLGYQTVSEIADFNEYSDLTSSTAVNMTHDMTQNIQPQNSIVNAFVVKDSSPNAHLKFREHEAEWINNIFLKGPSGGTSRFYKLNY